MHARAWLVLHVLAAIAGMGPEVAFGVMGPRARRRGRDAARAVYDAIDSVRRSLVFPALGVQVVSGIALIILRSGPFPAWLWWSLVAYAVALAIVGGVLVPAGRELRRMLASADGADTSAVVRRLRIAGGFGASLLTLVAVLMVWQP